MPLRPWVRTKVFIRSYLANANFTALRGLAKMGLGMTSNAGSLICCGQVGLVDDLFAVWLMEFSLLIWRLIGRSIIDQRWPCAVVTGGVVIARS